MSPLNYPRVVTARLRLSWTRWLQKRALKKLVREQRRLEMLEKLVEEQTVKVGRLILDQQQLRQERQMFLEIPVEPQPTPKPLNPPDKGTPPPFRATPELEEKAQDPMADLAQRLGLPAQQS